MDIAKDVHGACEEIYRAAHLPLDVPASPNDLCRRFCGGVPEYARINCDASVARVRGRWRIFLRRGVSQNRARFAVLHELAHVYYSGAGFSLHEMERRCDRLGAALAVPHPVIVRAFAYSHDVQSIAETFVAPQTLVLLRWGECRGVPVALVSPRGLRVRGEPYPWPVRSLIRRRVPHNLPARIVWITDAPRRIGYVVA